MSSPRTSGTPASQACADRRTRGCRRGGRRPRSRGGLPSVPARRRRRRPGVRLRSMAARTSAARDGAGEDALVVDDDSRGAAARTARRRGRRAGGPWTRATVPPRWSISRSTSRPRRCGSTQPSGLRSSSTTSSQPSSLACLGLVGGGAEPRRSARRRAAASGARGSRARGSRGRGRRSRPRSRRPGGPAGMAGRRAGRACRPTRRTATWSPSLMASSMSWVTKRIVLPSSPCRRRNSSWSCSRTTGSTAQNGSSMSITGGSAASARATPTRCCWPPESWRGSAWRSAVSRPTRSSSSIAAVPRPSCLSQPSSSGTVAMLSSDGAVREEARRAG